MGYRIQSDRPLKKEIKRIFHEQACAAAGQLARYPGTDPEGLHESRKHIKRMRAIVRLLGEVERFRPPAKALKQHLRETASLLSEDRDREVLIGWLNQCAISDQAADKPLLKEACQSLASRLEGNGHGPPPIPPATRQKVQASLGEAESMLAQCLSGKLSKADLAGAARRREKKWEKGHRDYRKNPGSETLHNWRKRLKDHYYLRKLLHKALGLKKKHTSEVKALERLLSEARDCDLLLETLMSRIDLRLEVNEVAALVQHAEALRSQFLHEADEQAKKLTG